MLSIAFLFGAGDVLAQQGIEKRGKDHDVRRALSLSPSFAREADRRAPLECTVYENSTISWIRR